LGALFFKDKIGVAQFCEVLEDQDIRIDMISQTDIRGIGFLGEHLPDGSEPGKRAPQLISYLSPAYREKNGITIGEEYIRLNYKEEKIYRDKFYNTLEKYTSLLEENKRLEGENRKLESEIEMLRKKVAGGDSGAPTAKINSGS
jgi:hypothetical protein